MTIRKHRRLLAQAAIAVSVATASAAGIALAQGSGSRTPTPPASTNAPSSISLAAHNALETLVGKGTIDQAQADAVQRQVDAGSVDPQTLVDGGTLNDAQMRAVATSLNHVKRSFGG